MRTFLLTLLSIIIISIAVIAYLYHTNPREAEIALSQIIPPEAPPYCTEAELEIAENDQPEGYRRISATPPPYPNRCQFMPTDIEHRTTIQFDIDMEKGPHNICVVRSAHPCFDEYAAMSVRGFQYTYEGEATPAPLYRKARTTFVFILQDDYGPNLSNPLGQ
ncbi:MAG: hypothetical protein MRY59_06770 [Aquisalinus sp.]|nr:hypothetical protein [Aquisalinus sp.]